MALQQRNIEMEREYAKAIEMMRHGEYQSAIVKFRALGHYKQAAEKCSDCSRLIAEKRRQEEEQEMRKKTIRTATVISLIVFVLILISVCANN